MNSDIGDSSEFTYIAIFSFMCQKCVIFHIFDICFVQNYTFSTHHANISVVFAINVVR